MQLSTVHQFTAAQSAFDRQTPRVDVCADRIGYLQSAMVEQLCSAAGLGCELTQKSSLSLSLLELVAWCECDDSVRREKQVLALAGLIRNDINRRKREIARVAA